MSGHIIDILFFGHGSYPMVCLFLGTDYRCLLVSR